MLQLITASLFLTIAGVITSVSAIGLGQILLLPPTVVALHDYYKKKKFQLPMSSWFLIGFVIVALLSLAINHEILIKPSKNYGRMKYFLSGVLYIYVFRSYLGEISIRMRQIIVYGLLFAIFVSSFVCFYQMFILNFERAKSLTDTLRYGYGMGMILPLLTGVALRSHLLPYINRKILWSTIVLGFISLYMTYNRGAMLALICSLPFVIYYWDRKKGIMALMIGGSVVAFLVGFYLFGTGKIGNRFISSMSNRSDNVRFTQWESAYRAWLEKPMMGIGFGDFINQNQKIKVKYKIAHPNYVGHTHNVYLGVLAGTGIIGFIFFMGWFVGWLLEVYKAQGDLAAIFIPFIISISVSGMFEVVLDSNNATMIFLLYALSMALIDQRRLSPS